MMNRLIPATHIAPEIPVSLNPLVPSHKGKSLKNRLAERYGRGFMAILVATGCPSLWAFASEAAATKNPSPEPTEATPTKTPQGNPSHGDAPVVDGRLLEGHPIDSISIQNSVGRTRDSFVRRKLKLREGQPFNPGELEAGLGRLRDTRIFKSVTAGVYARGTAVHVEIILAEKWTTLPDLRFGGGGGTAYFRAGVFDINWFGLGGQGLIAYENRSGTNNGDAWLRYPNVWGSEHLLGAGLTRSTTLLTDYGSKREILGGQAMSKTTLLLDYEYSFSHAVVFGYRMEPEWVQFNDYQVASNVKRMNEALGRRVSPSTRRILHRLQLQLGNLNYQGVLARGIELNLQWLPASQSFGSDYDVLMTRNDLLAFHIFPGEWNVASRLTLKTSTNARPENISRVGGLSEIRGYFDGEFFGRYALYSSLELRKNALTTWSFVWQPAVFYDWGLIDQHFSGLWQQKLRDGIGLGIRVVPDFVHLATFRLDYAWGLSDRRNDGGVSFGVLHFF